jgi:hypothetical protein
MSTEKQTMKNRFYRFPFVPFLIVALFLLPAIIARLFYFHGKTWFSHKVNHGVLLSSMANSEAIITSKTNLPAKWLLAYTSTEKCEKDCLDNLVLLHRLRLAFGSDSQRINYALFTNPKYPISKSILKQLPELLHQSIPQHSVLSKQGYYIIDPHHNAVLYYTSKTEPKPIYDDLKRLLKASRIG